MPQGAFCGVDREVDGFALRAGDNPGFGRGEESHGGRAGWTEAVSRPLQGKYVCMSTRMWRRSGTSFVRGRTCFNYFILYFFFPGFS